MKVTDIIKSDKPTLSFEVFPPKISANFESVKATAEKIADLNPSYMSVTYGAGGGTSDFTVDLAEDLMKKGVTPLTHLTCVSSTEERIEEELKKIKSKGIKNILALRGDIPEDLDRSKMKFTHACELIKKIKEFDSELCIGGACYPETHPESESSYADIESLKLKVESGCEFLTTQMFFDNNILYNFIMRLYKVGVDVPVVAGIMPVTNAKQIKRIMSISGSALPQRFIRIVDRFADNPAALKEAGIAYATEQIVDLYANGINAVHIYSMNNPEVAEKIKNNLTEILK
ncbi:MAG: methylenetetrahydrofolate reductase [Acutalibacteraceae bacterium]|nr:methylenetetrahydrofolate reductase [Acutalibacteraceae bacterium]